MKKIRRLILLGLLCVISIGASAYDFSAKNADGKIIYYKILSSADLTCEVTYKGKYADSSNPSYSGTIKIPETITYNSKTYSVTSIGEQAFYDCSGLTSVTIPNSVTSIGSFAFYGCKALTSVTIPNSVTSIEWGTFLGSGLKTITIPNSVTSIQGEAFSWCFSLTSVTIPNSVTSIGDRTFQNCKALTSVTIPNSVTIIGSSAFEDCKALTSVNITDLDKWAEIEFNSLYSNPLFYAEKLYLNGKLVVSAKLTTATKISKYAFYRCRDLRSIEIPDSVTIYGVNPSGRISINVPNSITSIGEQAFYGCSGLKSVTIGYSVTSIGRTAFEYCTGLTSVTLNSDAIVNKTYTSNSNLGTIFGTEVQKYTIGDSVKGIGDYTFYVCSKLKELTISNSVESIGKSAFSGCSGLTSIEIPNSVTSIGTYAFQGCSGLTSITIPNSVTSIGSSAFSGCTSLPVENNLRYADTFLIAAVDKTLSTYTIKEGTKWIGSSAFAWCSGLTSITIPSSVTSIGESAFFRCDGLTSVNMKATTPPTCESDVFFGVDISNTSLIVPAGGVITYKKADVWKDFGTITDGEVEFPKIKATQKEVTQTTITLMLVYDKEKCIPFEEIGVKWGSSYYKANSEGIVKIEHLCPNTSGIVYGYAKYGGEYYVSKEGTSVRTKPINSEIAFSDIMANKAFVRGVYDIGDAHVYKTTFELKIPTEKGSSWTGEEIEYKNDKFTLMGLEPDTEYGVCYTVYYHYGENDEYSGSEYDKQYFTTAELKMTTLLPKNVSSTTSIVAAEANISDDETGAGFEWRKYDAPESLPSSRGKAIVFDGKMEGKINNLQPVYYNVRPYYESASGNMYYGDWMTFDPTDFSYFEPTVHTYDFPEDPSSNSVEVRGYVMQGTDDVMEQGFEYWKTSDSQRKMASNGEVMRVKATGQLMIATLKDLDYESHYVVRAYVITAGGTVYGEERTFATPADPTSGIIEVKESESVSRSLKGIYTMDGRKIERITAPGIYIRNGRKILVRQDQLPLE